MSTLGVGASTQVAQALGIAASTWRAYQARRDAGVPRPLDLTAVGPDGRVLEVWDRDELQALHAARPGKGGRPAGVGGA